PPPVRSESQLGKTQPPVAAGHSVETRPPQQARQPANTEPRPAIALLRQSQQGVGPDPDLAPHPSGEVDAQKWKGRVRHRIDQTSNEARTTGPQRRVPAAHGHDTRPA